MASGALSPDSAFGKHILAQDCTIPVEGHREDSSWMEFAKPKTITIPQGTIIDVQSGSGGRMRVLLHGNGTGYIVQRSDLEKFLVE